MYKSLVVLAFFCTMSACAAQPAAVRSAQPAKTAQEAEADKTRVCEDFELESTGTRLGTERVCRTAPVAKENPPNR